METIIFAAADFANTDGGGKLNIIGIFNFFYAQYYPYVHPLVYLATYFAAELGETSTPHNLNFEFHNADGQAVWISPHISFTPSIPKSGRRAEHIYTLGVTNFVIPAAGLYEFRLFVDGETKGAIAIDAVLTSSR